MPAVSPSQMTHVNLACLFDQFDSSQASVCDGSSMGHVSSSERSLGLLPGQQQKKQVSGCKAQHHST